MNIIREVGTATVDEIDDALVIGFPKLELDGGAAEYVMFQRSLDPDEDGPGIDGVYVERDGQGFGGYGGIVRFVLHRDRAVMELDDRIGRALGRPDVWHEVTIHLTVDGSTFEVLRSGLARVFVGCGCFIDQS